MRKIHCNSLLLAALFIGACATTEKVAWPNSDAYELKIIDDEAGRKFDLILLSKVNRQLCVSVESWPGSSGGFLVRDEDVSLTTANKRLFVNGDFSSAYCPGGCGVLKIAPMGEMKGYISYASFGDEDEISKSEKRILSFSVSPFFCR